MKRTDRVEAQKSKVLFLRIYPKCPFYKSAQAVSIILALIALGTVGIYFLSLWAAVAYLAYSLLWYFVAMPLTMCRYCYFKTTETTIDRDTGETVEKLLSVDKWSASYLQTFVKCGGRYTVFMSIVWLLPIVLIVISFFLSFSILALLALLGFVAVLVANYFYMLRKKCPSCAIKDECHSSFGRQR